MTRPPVAPLKHILALGRPDWERPETRPAVREAFAKVLDCGTAALGAEVFASAQATRVVYHTCKSRACPSCGYRATTLWQREQWRELPDIPYTHLTLTMPDVLWPIFQHNRQLLHDLPVLGAKVIEQWARRTYGVRYPNGYGGNPVQKQSNQVPVPGFTRTSKVIKMFDVANSTWYGAVADGRIDRPIKLGPHASAYRNEYVNELLARVEAGEPIL